MAIMRWDPFTDLNSLHSQVDDLFNEMFAGHYGKNAAATDVYTEDDKKMVIETHLPNFDDDEVKVDVHQGVLEIRAEHKEKQEEKEGKRKYLVRESSSNYYRRIALPQRSDESAIEADFSGGLLKVTIPFKELPAKKSIKVGAKSSSKTKK